MAKFCNSCGTQLDDNTTFCNNCGTKVEAAPQAQAQTAYAATSTKSLPKLDKSLLKILIPAAAGIVLLIVVISIIVGNGYKKPIKNMVNGFNDGDEEVYCDALPDFLIKKYDKADDDYYKNVREKIKNQVKSWEESKVYDLGDDIEVSYKILDKIEYNDDELESVQSLIKSMYDKKVEVTKGYNVALLLTIEGEDGEFSEPAITQVYKIDGKWCVLDTNILVDSSTYTNDYSEDIYESIEDYIS